MERTGANAGSVRAQYDWSTADPTLAVVDAIAALENVRPTELSDVLDTTLAAHVDPDALDTLVGDGCVSVSFSIDDYRVRIDRTGLVVSYDGAVPEPRSDVRRD
jgi:hypothetical protein